jgi:Amt family ammonium transporter
VEGLEISLGDTVRTQLTGVVATLVWSGVATFVLVKITQALVGLRVDADTETEGLDLIAHGERGYDL